MITGSIFPSYALALLFIIKLLSDIKMIVTFNFSESTKDEVKAKLLKLAGSAENGTEDEGGLSRTAKLVLAAKKGSAGKSKETTPNKSAFYSDMVAQKYGPEVYSVIIEGRARHFVFG